MKKLIKLIKGQYSFNFLLGYLMMKLGISSFFKIPQKGFFLKFYPSALSLSLWTNPTERDEELLFIGNFLKEGDTIVDIGANIGQVLIFAAIKVKKIGRVIGFEPHPKTFSYLSKNIEINKISNAVVHNLALGDEEGEILFSNNFSDDQNKIENHVSKNSISVKIKRLDSLTKDLAKINLLKIDVEGYELSVFKGASETLKKTNYIFFESWEKHFNNFNYSTQIILDFLETKGFEVYKIASDATLERIDKKYSSKNCENLLAINKNF